MEIFWSVIIIGTAHFLIATAYYALFQSDKWKANLPVPFLRELVFVIPLILVVAVTTKLLHSLFGFSPLNGTTLLHWLGGAFCTLAIPYGLRAFFLHWKEKSMEQPPEATANLLNRQEKSTSQPERIFTLTDESLDSRMHCLNTENFYYLQSMGNYVNVHWAGTRKMEKDCYRLSMRKLKANVMATDVVQCHRSYMVNLSHVEAIRGNTRGYKLILSHQGNRIEVPATATYVNQWRSRLESA